MLRFTMAQCWEKCREVGTLGALTVALAGGLAGTGQAATPIYRRDFMNLGDEGRWEFKQVLPPTTRATRMLGIPAETFNIEVTKNKTFGFLGTKSTKGGRVVPSAANTIVFFTWEVAVTGGSAPAFLSPMRLRASAADGSIAATATFHESPGVPYPQASPPYLLLNDGVFRSYTSATYAPPEVMDTVGGKGFVMALDVLGYGNGAMFTPQRYSVRTFLAQEVPVAALGSPTDLLKLDFTTSPSGLSSAALPAAAGGRMVEFDPVGGLAVDPVGGIQIAADIGDPDDSGRFPGLSYAYGNWGGPLGLAVDSTLIYRMEYVLSSAATTRDKAHVARLRFRAGQSGEYTYTTEIGSQGASRFSFPPDRNGETYTAFVMFPHAVHGLPMYFNFDVYAADPADAGAITLTNLKVQSYLMPTIEPVH